jgi:hypothetical protein
MLLLMMMCEYMNSIIINRATQVNIGQEQTNTVGR